MNRDLIYQIREKPALYQYLKYNSYLYKNIIRNDISIKELEDMMKKSLKLTTADRLNNINNKMELVNAILNVFK